MIGLRKERDGLQNYTSAEWCHFNSSQHYRFTQQKMAEAVRHATEIRRPSPVIIQAVKPREPVYWSIDSDPLRFHHGAAGQHSQSLASQQLASRHADYLRGVSHNQNLSSRRAGSPVE